jgi:hypothetical protein
MMIYQDEDRARLPVGLEGPNGVLNRDLVCLCAPSNHCRDAALRSGYDSRFEREIRVASSSIACK